MAFCKVQTASFEKLGNAFEATSKAESSLCRIQRFIAAFVLDSDLIVVLIFNFLSNKEKLTQTIDRSNWQFGQTDINVFNATSKNSLKAGLEFIVLIYRKMNTSLEPLLYEKV